MDSVSQPVFFISHGCGPWPWIAGIQDLYAKTAHELALIPSTLPAAPKAVLVISGHWEEDDFTVSTAAHPPMIYDYSGFPEHTYHLKYPAPGSPAVAERVHDLLSAAGISCGKDPTHGFDHGVFVPLFLMYPAARVPVVTLSMKSSYDPAEHWRMGEALRPLRDEGVPIVGSGLSYHNLRKFFAGTEGPPAAAFEQWLNAAISNPDRDECFRRLVDWESAPHAREAHPNEDHLLPLMVVAGAASGPGHRMFMDEVMNIPMASYRFP